MTNTDTIRQIYAALRSLLVEARILIRSSDQKILWYQIMMRTRDAQDAALHHASPAIAADDIRSLRQWVTDHRALCRHNPARLAEYDHAETLINNTLGTLSRIKP